MVLLTCQQSSKAGITSTTVGWFYGGGQRLVEGDRWMTDSVYGSMFLNGCNPSVVERCEKLPNHFPVTDEHVKGALDRGISLQQEMKV